MGVQTVKPDYSHHLEQPAEFEVQSTWWASPEGLEWKRQIAERIPDGSTVLDAGAGSGAAIPCWLEHATHVTAVDSCDRAIGALMHHFGPQSAVVHGDLRRLEHYMYGRSFDVVLCIAVLKHFSPEEWRTVLGELFAVADKRVIFTMGIADDASDRNIDAPYYDRAEPMDVVCGAIPVGWAVTEIFGDPLEPAFVCDRIIADGAVE